VKTTGECAFQKREREAAVSSPPTAVAEWTGAKVTVWTGTQRPFGVRTEIAQAFHQAEDQVRVIVPDMGSGYGGKHTGEQAVEAARLARAAGRPVKLVYTRAEEFMWGYFRPGGVIDLFSRTGLYIIACKVHRMSVAQAEEFYGPVLPVLQNKLKVPSGETAARLFSAETNIKLGKDVEALHHMRVATRRQRAAFRVVAPYFRRGAIRGFQDELRSAAGYLGTVRDLDVLIEAANLLFYFLKAPQGGIPVVQTGGAESQHWVSSVDMVSLMALILTLFAELMALIFSPLSTAC
jgi:hypothetical protein